ncbi:MAG: glutamyl-tRNA reductase [Nocardioidaceae bacterium]
MNLAAVGVNHHTCDVQLREHVAIPRQQLPTVLRLLHNSLDEVVVLSTCNRTEVYAAVERADLTPERLAHLLASSRGLSPDMLASRTYQLADIDVAEHLFKVAAGVDSMILGEPQILGQVRSAFAAAQRAGTVGAGLSLLLRRALHAGKRARAETDIARGAASIGQATIALCRKAVDDLTGRRVAVVGAGEMAHLIARCLSDAGVGRLVVLSRTVSHAQLLADQLPDAQAHPMDRLSAALADVDLVVTALDARRPVLTSAMAAAAVRHRADPLHIIDVGVPRNVAPDVSDLAGVTVFDLDDLQDIVAEGLAVRVDELDDVRAILTDELCRFAEQWHALAAAPTIRTILGRADQIKESELRWARARLHDLPAHDIDIVEQLLTRTVNKLLHAPLAALRSNSSAEYRQIVGDLFEDASPGRPH